MVTDFEARFFGNCTWKMLALQPLEYCN